LRVTLPGARRLAGVIVVTAFGLLSSADGTSALAAPAAHYLEQRTVGVTLASVLPELPPPPQPLTRDLIIEMVAATWPEDPDTAVRILMCESHGGENPDAFSLETPNGGPMQLNRFTWEPFFAGLNGWTWEQIVTDINIHLQAARIIYDRWGGWEPWRCR
jgi:hypothetical protein